MDSRQRADLDRHITGNYGEDQFSDKVEFLTDDEKVGIETMFCTDCGGSVFHVLSSKHIVCEKCNTAEHIDNIVFPHSEQP